MVDKNDTESADTTFDRLDAAMEQMPAHGDIDPAALALLDIMMESAEKAILGAQRVFVSDETRMRFAALQSELYDRPVPVAPPDERTRLPDASGRIDASAANVLVGLVDRALRDLGEEPGEWDALDLVRAWLERGQRGDDNIDGAYSALHLIASERASPVPCPSEGVLDDAMARLPLAQWQALMSVIGSALGRPDPTRT